MTIPQRIAEITGSITPYSDCEKQNKEIEELIDDVAVKFAEWITELAAAKMFDEDYDYNTDNLKGSKQFFNYWKQNIYGK